MEDNSKKGNSKIRQFPTEDERKDRDNTGEEFRRMLMKEADQYEKRLKEDKSLDIIDQIKAYGDVEDLEQPPELFKGIMDQLKAEGKWEDGEEKQKDAPGEGFREEAAEEISIEDIYSRLPETERKAYDIGKKKLMHRKRNKRLKIAGSVAMVFLCLFLASMSSEANREYMLALWHTVTGTGYHINVETVSEAMEDTTAENEVYEKIQKELGITPVRLGYKPEGMKFSTYVIGSHSATVTMQYLYNDVVFNVFMSKNSDDVLRNQKFDGKVLDSFQVKYNSREFADVVELENENEEKSYAAEFKHNNAYYAISGVIPKKDFTKLLNNISF